MDLGDFVVVTHPGHPMKGARGKIVGRRGEYRDLSCADPAVVVHLVQRGEAEEPRFDGSKQHFLKHGIVPDVAEHTGLHVRRPVGAIEAGLELVAIDDADEDPVLARQISEAANPAYNAHVNRETRPW